MALTVKTEYKGQRRLRNMGHNQVNASDACVVSSIDTKVDYHLEKLDSENYVTWRWQISNVLRAKNLESAIINQNVSGQIQQSALALIGSALDNENKMLVVGCTSAFEVWSRPESIYENKTTFETQALLEKVHSFRISSIDNIAQALGQLQALLNEGGSFDLG